MSASAPGSPGGVPPYAPYSMQPLIPTQPKPIAAWVWIGSVMVVVVLAATAFFGYRAYRGATAQYKELVAPLHEKMIARDVDSIFAESDPLYQEKVGAVKSKELFDFVHDKLGDPGESSMASFNATTATNEGDELFLVFATEFTNGMVTETFTFHKVDGKYRMRGYQAKSPLMTKENTPEGIWRQ